METDLAAARASRTDAYDGTKGLREKMKSIKESEKSQYGFRSPQFTLRAVDCAPSAVTAAMVRSAGAPVSIASRWNEAPRRSRQNPFLPD